MVNRKRIPLEMMLNKTESIVPLLYDSDFINLKKFISKEVYEQRNHDFLYPFGIYLPQKHRIEKAGNVFFSVSVPLWQNIFAEGKNNGSKLKSITR
jgi:hypothetical protein